jgi:hypothetical protein
MALPTVNVNEVAIFVAALASMVLGALWYSPLLFGKAWIRLSGIDEKKMAVMKKRSVAWSYLLDFIGTLLMLYVVAHFVLYLNVKGTEESFQFAFWLWVGLIAPTHLGIVLWEGKPLALYLINVGYYLVALLIAIPILAIW